MSNKKSCALRYLMIVLITIYRWTISPLIGNRCRFYPSCSEYGLKAFKTHPFLKACFLTVKRLVKCHPWHPGGVDEVPKNLRLNHQKRKIPSKPQLPP